MPDYALLIRPAANRVFGGDAARLLMTELEVLAGDACAGIERTTIAGIEYVTFSGDPDLRTIAALSSTHALYERRPEGLFRPVGLPIVDRYDDDLVTTQRYVGKTNETLTKLLVNLALGAAPSAGDRQARILDPLCGRGTTCNQVLTAGGDALGIDIDAKDTQAYATFLTTWLEEKRIKHQRDATAGRHRFRITIGRKGAAGAEARQIVDVLTGDTTEAPTAFGRSSVDAIVTDLPYGVHHGSRTGSTLARRPADLLADALPAWREVLRPGGALVLAWNTRVLRRDDLVALLQSAGLSTTTTAEAGSFVHRVDRTITRDVVVAVRPPN